MSLRTSSRSLAASAVGWVLILVIGWILLRFVLGTIFWIVRGAILIAIVIGLLLLWLTLKAPDDD